MDKALLVPQYVVDEEKKKMSYHDKLRGDIREFVSMSICITLEDMIARAREKDVDMELLRKRGPVSVHSKDVSRKTDQ